MHASLRYFRLLISFGRYSLAREMTFRGNFLLRIGVEVLWLGVLLVFYRTVFAQTSHVAGWSEAEYFFFVGCYFALEGVVETFFLENCNEVSDLVRSGDLDLYLLKPIDEQFLISCRKIDWATAPNILLGAGVMVLALRQLEWVFEPWKLVLFAVLFGCGTAMAYAFLLLLTSATFWFTRNQGLFELWWLFTSLMRYPRDIFTSWALPLGWFFTFVVPVLLVVNVPAAVMVRTFEPAALGYTLVATLALVLVSRAFFRYALGKYRSASS